MTAHPLLEAALACAARGWHVFPCGAGEKLPLTKHGWKDATRDAVVIEHWWSERPDSNVAVATGPSSLVVADFDARHGGLGLIVGAWTVPALLAIDVTTARTLGGIAWSCRLNDRTRLASGAGASADPRYFSFGRRARPRGEIAFRVNTSNTVSLHRA